MNHPSTLPARSTVSPVRVSPSEVERELDRILSSDIFSRAERMKRFLRFTVSMSLEGRVDELKEYSIGVAAYDKPEDFDPRLDPIVRVEAGRLRTKLREYYATEGRQDSVLIRFQKRSYVPQFELRGSEPGSEAADPVVSSSAPLLVESSKTFRQEAALESIAVLPFADLSPKRDQEYFCDGITEELINVLSRIEGLNVAPRTTAMQFKDRVGDVRSIGQQLNVRTVLEGSVRKDGKRIRISTQLISVADGYNLWSDVYNHEMRRIFEVQQNIAQSIVQALKLRLTEDSAAMFPRSSTRDFQAYKLYLQGRHYWRRRDPDGLRRAVRCFQKAIERDSKYAPAHAGMADTHASMTWAGTLAPEIGWACCRQSAERALQLDPTLALALSSQAAMRAVFEWDWAGAEEAFRRAIELDPSYGPAHYWNATFCLAPQGRLDEAEKELLLGRDLDPLAPAVYAHLGWLHYCRKRWEFALESCETCLELNKGYYAAHCLSGYVYLLQGYTEKALSAFRTALAVQGQDSMAIGGAGRCHAALGERKEASALLARLKRRSRSRYVPETDIAQIYIGAGQLDAAFEWLGRAADRRCARLVGLRVDPAYDSLRDDPRFGGLLAQMALDE